MANTTPQKTNKLALWVLLFGNFVIGTGVLLPAGLLNQLAAELSVSIATAGLLLLAGGLVVGVGAPVLAALTSRHDRRKLLVFALGLYAVGHLASALVDSFWPLLAARTLMISAAAIYSPQAAATVGLLVPLEKRSAAIAFVFIGWSIASVAGIPLGSLLGAEFGWRAVFLAMAGLSVLAGVANWYSLRPGLKVVPLNAAAWRATLTSPALLMVLMVTLLSMSGQFVVFGYLAPILAGAYGASPGDIALAFAVAGVTGVIGNTVASQLVGRMTVSLVIALSLGSLACGLAVFALFFGNYAMALVGLALWGLGTFSSNSLQQSRLVGLAPALASATVALNTSAVYLGQAVGAGVGGYLLKDGVHAISGWIAFGFLLAALAVSLVASKLRT